MDLREETSSEERVKVMVIEPDSPDSEEES